MRKSHAIAFLVSTALCLGFGAAVNAADQPNAAPDPKAMEAMNKAITPGPEQAELMKQAGDWDATVTMHDPGQTMPPMKGTCHMEPILDGHYLQIKFDGQMTMGERSLPFHGMGIAGYDNVTKKYFSTWFDSMMTGCMYTTGDKAGDTVTLTGKCANPMSGKEEPVKEVLTHIDPTHMHYELFMTGPDGKEFKAMEIDYTKKQ